MQTRTYGDLFKLIQSLAGVGSFATSEQDDVANLINRRYFEAYQTSQMWPRYLVVGEERTIESGQVVPYAETGKNTIGEFIRIHRQQPFLNNSTLEFDFYVDSSGAHILNISTADASSAYITYKKELVTGFNQDSTNIPSEFVDYIIYTALSDFYTGDGQTEKAALAAAQADLMLDREIFRVDKKMNNNTVNKRFSTYVSRQAR